jgi:hypothetical protein
MEIPQRALRLMSLTDFVDHNFITPGQTRLRRGVNRLTLLV